MTSHSRTSERLETPEQEVPAFVKIGSSSSLRNARSSSSRKGLTRSASAEGYQATVGTDRAGQSEDKEESTEAQSTGFDGSETRTWAESVQLQTTEDRELRTTGFNWTTGSSESKALSSPSLLRTRTTTKTGASSRTNSDELLQKLNAKRKTLKPISLVRLKNRTIDEIRGQREPIKVPQHLQDKYNRFNTERELVLASRWDILKSVVCENVRRYLKFSELC